MFDNLKAMGAVAGLLQNQDKLKGAMERVKRSLAEMRLSGESGGGAVRSVVSGDLRVVSVEIGPAVATGLSSDSSRRMAEVLIAEAVNDGLRKAQAAARDAISAEAKALGLPDLPAGLGGLLG
jgi:nucleoid-associated protein EbfC